MHLIKLDATESTNNFLKDYSSKNEVKNFTVIWAKEQTKGRGQMNATWSSEPGKNLTFSVLVRVGDLLNDKQFYISKIVAIAIEEALVKVLPKTISIKWPNDIMAGTNKIAGVLIENRLKNGKVSESIVGVGLNVNQRIFTSLPNATSIANLIDKELDLETLLYNLIESIKTNFNLLLNGAFKEIDEKYLTSLYRFEKPCMYCDSSGTQFMAKIVGVTERGLLQLEMEDKQIQEFDLKQLQFV